jgi:hypothetical protein
LLPASGPPAAETAASVVLRLKGLQAEEEAYLGRMVWRGADPRAQALGIEIAALRRQLAGLSHTGGRAEQFAALTAALEAQELALGRISRDYAQHLQVRAFNLTDLQATLGPRTALLEIREYAPYDFRNGQFAPVRWAGLLLSGDSIRVVDLGPVAGTREHATAMLTNAGSTDGITAARALHSQALLGDAASPTGRAAAADLHAQLFAPFAAALARIERLHFSPDGMPNLVPFAALRRPDGRRLAEMQDVRLLQTGRDLLRPPPDRPASGLLALGGIDFGAVASIQIARAAPRGSDLVEATTRAAAALATGFRPLPATQEEVRTIAARYQRTRRNESVDVWEGSEASEVRLRALD